jgi:hypothetical protein
VARDTQSLLSLSFFIPRHPVVLFLDFFISLPLSYSPHPDFFLYPFPTMPGHSKIDVAIQTRAALLKNRTIRCLYKTTLQAESRLSVVVIAWAQGRAEKFGRALVAETKATDQGEGTQQQQQHREGGEGRGRERYEELGEELGEEPSEEPSGERSEEKRGEESAELEQPKQQPTEEPNDAQDATNEKKQTADFDVQMNMVNLSRRNVFLCFDLFLKDCDAAVRSRVDQSLEEPIHFVFRKDGMYYIQPKRHLDSEVSKKYHYKRSKDKGPRPLYSDLDNPPLYDSGRRVPDEERHKYGLSSFFEKAGRPRHLRHPTIERSPEVEDKSNVVKDISNIA